MRAESPSGYPDEHAGLVPELVGSLGRLNEQ